MLSCRTREEAIAALKGAGCWLQSGMASESDVKLYFQEYVAVIRNGDEFVDTSVEHAKHGVGEYSLYAKFLCGRLSSVPLSGPTAEVRFRTNVRAEKCKQVIQETLGTPKREKNSPDRFVRIARWPTSRSF